MAISFDKVTNRVTTQTWTAGGNGPSSTQSFRILGMSRHSDWGPEDQYGGANWTQNDYSVMTAHRSNSPDLVVLPGAIIPASYETNVSDGDVTNYYILVEVLT